MLGDLEMRFVTYGASINRKKKIEDDTNKE